MHMCILEKNLDQHVYAYIFYLTTKASKNVKQAISSGYTVVDRIHLFFFSTFSIFSNFTYNLLD